MNHKKDHVSKYTCSRTICTLVPQVKAAMPHPTHFCPSDWWEMKFQRARRNMMLPFSQSERVYSVLGRCSAKIGPCKLTKFLRLKFLFLRVRLCIQYACVRVCLIMCESVKTCACFSITMSLEAWPGDSGIFPFIPLDHRCSVWTFWGIITTLIHDWIEDKVGKGHRELLRVCE